MDVNTMLSGYMDSAALLTERIEKLKTESATAKVNERHELRKRILTMTMMLCDCICAINHIKKYYAE